MMVVLVLSEGLVLIAGSISLSRGVLVLALGVLVTMVHANASKDICKSMASHCHCRT